MIVIHAGMPKAGSSTIQEWLRRNARRLREQSVTVVTPSAGSGSPDFVPYESGSVNSGWLVDRAIARLQAGEDTGAPEDVADGLARAAERYGAIVITGESFAHPFWSLHEPTLRAFEQLARSHEVRVAYYARPQHTALEAAWRQWGFRSGRSPAEYVAEYSDRLHHASTAEGVSALAPSLDFTPRPLRAEWLRGEDLVADFAGRFLEIEVSPDRSRSNPGLPLELAILLRTAPAGMFWESTDDNRQLEQLKRALRDLQLPTDARIDRSREILRRYAHETFGAENAELGWESFVPAPDGDTRRADLGELDELWSSTASGAERTLFYDLLAARIRPSARP